MTTLPTEKSKKNNNLSDQIILVYGRAKIGKSTLCSYFPDAVFLATEPGLNHLEVFKINITSWEGFLQACGELASGGHPYKTIIIDTVDNLITYCQDFVCKENGVGHVSELPHGRGWMLVTSEISRALVKLSSLPYGLIIVSHSKQEEIETKTAKFNSYTIDVSGKTQNIIMNLMDIILFMDSQMIDGEEIGVVRTKPSLYWSAGDKSKLLAESIEYPLDNPKVAYDVIAKAFQSG